MMVYLYNEMSCSNENEQLKLHVTVWMGHINIMIKTLAHTQGSISMSVYLSICL